MKQAFSISWDRKKVGITYIWIFLRVEFLAPSVLHPKLLLFVLCVCVCVYSLSYVYIYIYSLSYVTSLLL